MSEKPGYETCRGMAGLIVCTGGLALKAPLAWRTRIDAVLRAGARAKGQGGIARSAITLWLREPEISSLALYEISMELAPACEGRGITFVIGDRVDIALACGHGAGVHLPALGLPVAQARELLGADRPIGVSCHDAAEIAAATGADYATLSPIWPTRCKPGVRALGPDSLACEGPGPPIFALGGITIGRIHIALAAGAGGVALRSAIMEAPDTEEAVDAALSAIIA